MNVCNQLFVAGKKYDDLKKFYNENALIGPDNQIKAHITFNIDGPGSALKTMNEDPLFLGSAWDAIKTNCIIHENLFEYTFLTPLVPPTACLEKLSAKYPLLTFNLKFEEDNFGFFGQIKFVNGVTTVEESYIFDDIVSYLEKHHNIKPKYYLELVKKAGIPIEVHNLGDTYDLMIFENIANDFISRLTPKPKYNFNAMCIQRILIESFPILLNGAINKLDDDQLKFV